MHHSGAQLPSASRERTDGTLTRTPLRRRRRSVMDPPLLPECKRSRGCVPLQRMSPDALRRHQPPHAHPYPNQSGPDAERGARRVWCLCFQLGCRPVHWKSFVLGTSKAQSQRIPRAARATAELRSGFRLGTWKAGAHCRRSSVKMHSPDVSADLRASPVCTQTTGRTN